MPTPGRSTTTSMPRPVRRAESPTPESWRSSENIASKHRPNEEPTARPTRASNDSRREDDLLSGVDGVRSSGGGVLERDASSGGVVENDLGGVEPGENDEVGAARRGVEVPRLRVGPRVCDGRLDAVP